MKKGFLAGFLLSLAVVLLPTFYYMDARSSSGRQGKTEIPATPPDLFGGNPKGDPFPSASHAPDPSLAPIPSSPAPPASSPGPDAGPSVSPSAEKEEPASEIVMLKKPLPVPAIPPSPPARPEGGIRTRVYDPDRIYTLRTAVSHVTLVDLPEDAKEVYMGDSKLFLAEVFGKRVKIKPITYNPDARTNMIIYTLNKRLTFRIVMVPPGKEDDLVTFLSPREETVVNLNPLKTEIQKSLEVKESKKRAVDRLRSMKEAGPTDPLPIEGRGNRIRLRLLGFTRMREDSRTFGLFEVSNNSRTPFRVERIRLRGYRRSILWEGQKQWTENADWETTFDREIPPGKSRRFLLPVTRIPSFGGRTGLEIEMNGQTQAGPEIIRGDAGGEGH
ncbi:TrbG/VirB9 family P-type conjugative transfer protein [Leptospirillum ferriphilum]|uniref:TrbG/VirB9 family P-type conjugative transfer protein n=1 Tax=Leptospirillum ferriphilum TaxID=178606 RepID=UPI0009876D18|nr:TrbG/VirB9 family P-type conjugative transfer protein [Leptospirillum ferriphilum]OOH80831.1 hypothetical protein BOX30_05165 [Leptospirillum ferriphilum]